MSLDLVHVEDVASAFARSLGEPSTIGKTFCLGGPERLTWKRIIEVIAEAHPDSTTDDERWECVDIKAVMPVKRPVTLEMIKADGRLDDMVLVKNSRLSVQPVTEAEWRIICDLAGVSG